jgi:adenosine kinase
VCGCLNVYELYCAHKLYSDQSVLDKYGLKENDAILAEEKHMTIYNELTTKYTAKFLAGGAAQNAARGAQVVPPFLETICDHILLT